MCMVLSRSADLAHIGIRKYIRDQSATETIATTAATKAKPHQTQHSGSMLYISVWLSQSFVTRSTCSIASAVAPWYHRRSTIILCFLNFVLDKTKETTKIDSRVTNSVQPTTKKKIVSSKNFQLLVHFFSFDWIWHYQKQTVHFFSQLFCVYLHLDWRLGSLSFFGRLLLLTFTCDCLFAAILPFHETFMNLI